MRNKDRRIPIRYSLLFHSPCGIRGLLSFKKTWSSTRNSKRLVGFSSIGRSRLIGSRATRLSALSSLILPLFPFLLGIYSFCPCDFAKRFLFRGRAVDVSALFSADDEFSYTLTGHLPSETTSTTKTWD